MSATTQDLQRVIIYTDGGCRRNPGPGGYGVVMLFEQERREISGGYRRTTNNRMEIMAAIAGLEALPSKCAVTIYTDSRYLVKSVEKGWAERWRSCRWRKADGEPASNKDLWERLLQLRAAHEVRFEWVKGHAGIKENERCDFLSSQGAGCSCLPADEGYESLLYSRGDDRRLERYLNRLVEELA